MRPTTILRPTLLALTAALCSGCVDTREYDYGPRVYRDDYDRGYYRPDYVYVDRDRRERLRYDRRERDGRGPSDWHRDRDDHHRFDRDRGDRPDHGDLRDTGAFDRGVSGSPNRGPRRIRVPNG